MAQSYAGAQEVTILLAIGGKATRAYPITGDAIAKHLILLGNGRTVIENVCRELQRAGFRRFVFCIGHHGNLLRAHLEKKSWVITEGVSFDFSVETTPLGPEGATLAAIETFSIEGQAMFIAGDNMLPWGQLAAMNELHAMRSAAVTMGLTGYITPRTTDVGKIIVDQSTMRLVHCYGRTETVPTLAPGTTALTSAGLMVATVSAYVRLCGEFSRNRQDGESEMKWRDRTLPWLLGNGRADGLYGHDLNGEVLDLGTPENILYGQEHWSDYVSS